MYSSAEIVKKNCNDSIKRNISYTSRIVMFLILEYTPFFLYFFCHFFDILNYDIVILFIIKEISREVFNWIIGRLTPKTQLIIIIKPRFRPFKILDLQFFKLFHKISLEVLLVGKYRLWAWLIFLLRHIDQ